jgi:hypothetical protein
MPRLAPVIKTVLFAMFMASSDWSRLGAAGHSCLALSVKPARS